MTLTTGKGWLSMTTKPLGPGYLIKNGAVTKRQARMPAGQRRNAEMKARRLTKAWAAKSKGSKP